MELLHDETQLCVCETSETLEMDSYECDGIPISNMEVLGPSNSFGEVNVTQSPNCHFGHKIVAQTLTIINNSQRVTQEPVPSLPPPKELHQHPSPRCCTWIILTKCGILILLLVIVQLVMFSFLSNESNDRIPEPWQVGRDEWSDYKNVSPCSMIVTSYAVTVAHTETETCQDLPSCNSLLRGLETPEKPYIDYNFMIGGDGRLYEGRGWECAADVNAFPLYSNCLKVAFIGDYRKKGRGHQLNKVQKLSFKRFLDIGVTTKRLKKVFAFVPQCCRNLPQQTGPGESVIKFLETFDNFFIRTCVKFEKGCRNS